MWLLIPDIGCPTSNRYYKPYSFQMSVILLFSYLYPPNYNTHIVIYILESFSHFVSLNIIISKAFPVPSITFNWEFHSQTQALGWEEKFEHLFLSFSNLNPLCQESSTLLEAIDRIVERCLLAFKTFPKSRRGCVDEDGWSPLHYAALSGSCDVMEYLLAQGAIWSLTDHLGHTAGDVAFSLNYAELYQVIANHGFRAELLRMTFEDNTRSLSPEPQCESNTPQLSSASNNAAFLASKLFYKKNSSGQQLCVDEEGNGVMLGWEFEIMQETAKRLCMRPEGAKKSGLAVLNVGFGLGIVDRLLQDYHPTRHVIVEAHPDVLKFMKDEGWDKKPGVVIYSGRWQEFLNEIQTGTFEANFDAVYWDTFSEDYRDLKDFFKNVFDLLSGPHSRFSWFHGLGATSRTLYDIYTEIAELDLQEFGLKTTWYEVEVNRGEAVWEGIKRRYWNVPSPYRLPICTFDI
ncbi:hypothetical protein O181_059805 [Austropuccinia psidii MF-1]|uniref:RMT2 domain-containing protein n=1 Tax=Austropuccinia psidii MF-1 TaxID=1389203 RepID=A0A9Q3HZ18_9BASI|nr:hypothetical protein [Austropuccinia psidii MF-1]